jgi:hypothetical protein
MRGRVRVTAPPRGHAGRARLRRQRRRALLDQVRHRRRLGGRLRRRATHAHRRLRRDQPRAGQALSTRPCVLRQFVRGSSIQTRQGGGGSDCAALRQASSRARSQRRTQPSASRPRAARRAITGRGAVHLTEGLRDTCAVRHSAVPTARRSSCGTTTRRRATPGWSAGRGGGGGRGSHSRPLRPVLHGVYFFPSNSPYKL